MIDSRGTVHLEKVTEYCKIWVLQYSLVCGRGYNIGVRLIEDFLARTNTGRCNDFRETADVISKVNWLYYCFVHYNIHVFNISYMYILDLFFIFHACTFLSL